ncbi:hypothetical protein CWI84_10345 [Idiomarina tyrosinivorans]|uniref:Uncharacterized protein n=2 Tax=Idiomarina tyrosinivorans TaxID=1445662 RepID=A0A432ZM24_9GAMM|nr:hypothetical protein CWI84_10345 [Idiomarina tyrosinivorans]
MNKRFGKLVGADSSFDLEIRYAVVMVVHTFADEIGVFDDLSVYLLKNTTDLPFITSDDLADLNKSVVPI